MNIAGIKSLEPGFKRYEIVPQFADIESLSLTANTVLGPIRVETKGLVGSRLLVVETPAHGEGEIALDSRESVPLQRLKGKGGLNRVRYRLPAGEKVILTLKYT
jgi:hypothetical protein